MKKSFNELAVEAINSGKLSDNSVLTLRDIIKSRQPAAPSVIDDFAYHCFLFINNKLNPDDPKQNKIAAKSSADNSDEIDKGDLEEIFGESFRYTDFKQLLFIMTHPDLPPDDTSVLQLCKDTMKSPRISLNRISKLRKESKSNFNFKLKILKHIYYYDKDQIIIKDN